MADRFVLDPQRSRVRLRTYAKGLFAALAHDLELEASPTGEVVHADGVARATIDVRADAIHVRGVVRRGHVHTDVLSASDVREIERKLRDELFAPSPALTITVTGTREAPVAIIAMAPPRGGSTRADVIIGVQAGDDLLEVRVRGALSMRALGLPIVHGPLHAFVVKDEVAIDALLFFT